MITHHLSWDGTRAPHAIIDERSQEMRLSNEGATGNLFAYQARPRALFLEDGRPLPFPNDARVTITFAPNPALGGASPPGRTVALGSRATIHYDANTGRTTIEGDPPLEEVGFDGVVGGVKVQLRGTRLELAFRCESRAQLLGVLNVFHYVLPLVLSITFGDAPTITTTSGVVGDVPFTWQVERSQGSWDVTTPVKQAERVVGAMGLLPLVIAPSNRRLLAGLSYFQRAIRLGSSGATAFEFTGEVMLNLAKCLEVLFPATGGRTREAARIGLIALGYGADEIEAWFLPAMALRSEVDVAHIRLTRLSYEQLVTIQQYAEKAEDWFRDMIQRLLAAMESGKLSIAPYQDSGPDKTITTLLVLLR